VRTKILLAVLVGLVLAVVWVPVRAAPTEGLEWSACPFDSRAECAVLAVPRDYRDPDGTTIDIHVSRVRSTNPDARRGTLVMNQGGPGPHLNDAAGFGDLMPRSVLDAYDIVSFDQRGFGESAPVRCGLSPDQQFTFPWAIPGGEPAVRARAEGIARQCAERGGPDLPFLGTANVARDVDRIRRALGEKRISFLGVSYGTYLGIAYDSLYPDRVDRLLLDSNVDPASAWRGTSRESMTTGVETRFTDLAAFLVEHQAEYGLGGTGAEVRRTFLDLVDRLDRDPLPTPDGTVLGAHLRIAMFTGLYADATFPLVGRLLAAARDRDPAAAAAAGGELQIWYNDDNDASAEMGVFCADGTWPRDPALYAKQAKEDAVKFPLTGGAGAAIWPCAYWPSDPIDRPIAVTSRGRSNVLLVNNLRDPATTHDAATSVRRQFGDRARLVSVDQGGHGSYLFSGNACAQRIGTDFLVHGSRPSADLVCPSAHAGLRGELEHLTAAAGAPGAVAEVRDAASTEWLSSGFADLAGRREWQPTDRVRIFSNTKTFVATVILQLVAERQVGLDEPVETYLPGLIRANGNDGREISVRQLLQHTSGLPDFDAAVFGPDGYHRHRFDRHTPREQVDAGTALPRLSVPGTEFHYSTTNYVVAGMIVEAVTGRPYAAEVTDRVLRPLGLRDTAMPGHSPTPGGRHARGYAHLDHEQRLSDQGRRIDATLLDPSLVWAGGEMVSTMSDLNTFFAALIGGRLLPPAQLAEMMRTVPADIFPGAGSGLGLFRVPLTCGGEYWAHGGSGIGYTTRQGYTTDGRLVSIAMNASPYTPDQGATLLKAVDTALCEAVPVT
jgi:CubicO group peptidase (beta-lactamase class C family)